MKIKRLPARTASLLMPFILSILMTFVVSAVATMTNMGPAPGFLGKWMSAWGLSWLIAFPTLLLALPLARRIVLSLVERA
ncbi:DUF2798 domain-containing protein [Rhizobium straminoryzae]|uniref:DUF2798 domain-containing protein n=1 Tax=Rhizobium straminoryzae TaxID=1387186 RepID=A0A549T880_9HYPH|nr:DUF2798 domain-containing protein [Rhizobium straminoryzae]TRL38050.1 DUF2798 domain-containing protein [Rhizobium straminoryzae]